MIRNDKNKIVSSCRYTVVWCTKYRRKVLETGPISERLYDIIEQAALEIPVKLMIASVGEDHVRLLLEVDPQFGVYRAVRYIKSVSSRVLREEFPELRSRLPSLWTASCLIMSVGETSEAAIREYLYSQKNV